MPSYQNNNNNFNFGANFDTGFGEDDEYQSYKIFKESGMTFDQRYEIRRENSGLVKGVLSFFKSTDNNFKRKLEDYIGKRTNISVSNGSLSEALETVVKEKFPLVVHVLDFNK